MANIWDLLSGNSHRRTRIHKSAFATKVTQDSYTDSFAPAQTSKAIYVYSHNLSHCQDAETSRDLKISLKVFPVTDVRKRMNNTEQHTYSC